MKLKRTLFYVLISELVFTILPIIVILFIRSYQGKFEELYYNTEWGIMAIILFGQSLVKFASGISNSKESFRWQLVSLIISLIIVFGLVPSVVLLIINLLDTNQSFWTHFAQMIWFVLSGICFFFIGYIGQKMLDE